MLDRDLCFFLAAIFLLCFAPQARLFLLALDQQCCPLCLLRQKHLLDVAWEICAIVCSAQILLSVLDSAARCLHPLFLARYFLVFLQLQYVFQLIIILRMYESHVYSTRSHSLGERKRRSKHNKVTYVPLPSRLPHLAQHAERPHS